VNDSFLFLHMLFDNGCWTNVNRRNIFLKNDTLVFVCMYIFCKITAVIADVVATNVRILYINFIDTSFWFVKYLF
jgi:hypothetical protein